MKLLAAILVCGAAVFAASDDDYHWWKFTSTPPLDVSPPDFGPDTGPIDSGIHPDATVDAGPDVGPDTGPPDTGPPAFANTGAITCDGVDDVLTITSASIGAILNGSTNSLICGWTYDPTLPGGIRYPWGRRTAGARQWVYMTIGSRTRDYVNPAVGTDAYRNDPSMLTAGTWMHHCVRHTGGGSDNATRLLGYYTTKDTDCAGASCVVAYAEGGGVVPAAMIDPGTSPMYVCAATQASPEWTGFVDEIAIWADTNGGCVPNDAQIQSDIMTGAVEDFENLPSGDCDPQGWIRGEGDFSDEMGNLSISAAGSPAFVTQTGSGEGDLAMGGGAGGGSPADAGTADGTTAFASTGVRWW